MLYEGYPGAGNMQNLHIFGQLPGQPVIQAKPISQGKAGKLNKK